MDNKTILEILKENEPMTMQDLALKLGADKKDVSKKLSEMKDQGLVLSDLATLTVRRSVSLSVRDEW